MVHQLLKHAYHSTFLRNVTVLSGGSFIGLLIPLLLLPIFTRIYGAEIYGIQSLLLIGFIAIAPLATGYFEMAIPTPKTLGEARGLAQWAMLLALLFSVAALVLIHLSDETLIAWFRIPLAYGEWLYAFPLIVLSGALMNIANFWLLRAEKFILQGAVKIIAAASTAVLAYAAHYFHQVDGLLIGFLGGFMTGAGLGIWAMHRTKFYVAIPRRALARRYQKFTLFGGIPTVCYTIATQLPLMYITTHYALSTAGHYGMIRGLLFAGVLVLATSIGQVLLNHITALARREPEKVWPYFCHVALSVTAGGVLLAFSMYALGPWFFELYLGKGWEDAATLARTLSPLLFFWLVGPTLAHAAIAVHALKPIGAWQIAYAGVLLTLVLAAELSYHTFLARFIVIDAVMYGIYALSVIGIMWRYHATRR